MIKNFDKPGLPGLFFEILGGHKNIISLNVIIIFEYAVLIDTIKHTISNVVFCNFYS